MIRLLFAALLYSGAWLGAGAGVHAQEPAAFALEQSQLATLRGSRSAADLRALGDLLAEGLIASPENPLRRPDRTGAITAYRAARAAGDRSEATLVRLAKLLLARFDGTRSEDLLEPLREVEGELRAAVFRGSGDAAYVLALAAELEVLGTSADKNRLLQSAIVLGNVSAVLETARSVELGATVRDTAMQKLEARAAAGVVDAMIALARLHADGSLVSVDREKARAWFEKAALTAAPEAKVELARHLLADADLAGARRARALLGEAAERGSRQAALLLGLDAATNGPMQVSFAEGRLWLVRAVAVDERAAAPHLVALDLRSVLSGSLPAGERQEKLQQALLPIAQDPEALTALANRAWSPRDAALVEPVLLPLLHDATLTGNVTAGLAYDAWLRASGLPLPDDAASALVASLRRSIAANVGFATFALADLALDDRLAETEVSRDEAVGFLFRAADAHVGQAMLRIAQMYAFGEIFAQSDQFATRWYRMAAGNRVEAAVWELADLQVRSRSQAAQKEALAFFNARLNAGDARAGTAMVRLQLASGSLDPRTLQRAEAAASLPEHRYELVKALILHGGQQSFDAAQRLLASATASADPVALVLEARMQFTAGNGSADPQRGLALLQRASALGAVEAKLALASLYLTRMRFSANQPEAVALLHEVLAARPKSIPARLLLSDAYLRGHGVARDPAKAAHLVKQVLAENTANPQASILEADWLIFSEDRRDPVRSAAILREQMHRGSNAAARELGLSFVNGFGTRIDPDRAAVYLRRAAEVADKEALAAMGHMLLNGVGMSADPEGGVRHLEQAAAAGNIAAMYDLSRVHALGALGTVDNKESAVWLRRAAELDHPSAAYQLGLLYLQGEGVPQDRAEAIKWFNRSAEVGNLLAARTAQTLLRSPLATLSDVKNEAD